MLKFSFDIAKVRQEKQRWKRVDSEWTPYQGKWTPKHKKWTPKSEKWTRSGLQKLKKWTPKQNCRHTKKRRECTLEVHSLRIIIDKKYRCIKPFPF